MLARLALGCHVVEEDIPCAGISKLTTDDFDYARTLESTIKLIATARKSTCPDTGRMQLETFVTPWICPLSTNVGNVNGAMNVVEIESDNLGSSHFIGAGAGSMPTANSVVADMVAVQKGSIAPPFPVPRIPDAVNDPDYRGHFLMRFIR